MRNMGKMAFVLMLAMLLFFVGLQCATMEETEELPLEEDWTYEITASGLKLTGYTGKATNLVIPYELNGYRVSIIGKNAFANQFQLKSVTIPEGVTSIEGNAFYGCTGLSLIRFNAKNCSMPGVDTYDNRNLGVFAGAGSASPNGLKVVFGKKVEKVPDFIFDTASIGTDRHSGHAYAYITEIEFSDSVMEIGTCAFRNCRELEELTMGEYITRIGSFAFWNCTGLKSIEFNDDLTFIGERAFSQNTSLRSIEWGNGMDTIDVYAFADCTALKKLDLPAPLTVIKHSAFKGCTSLQEVTIPVSLTSIEGDAFYGDVKLNSIVFNAKNCSVRGVDTYDDRNCGVFSGAGSASPNGLKVVFGKKVEKIPDYLFDTASIGTDRHSGHAYAYITEIEFSDSVMEIGTCAFRNCRELEELTTGEYITGIGSCAFWGCTGLKSIEFNDDLTFIGDQAFAENTGLRSIKWGTSMDTIDAYAFSNCTSMKKLVLPETLKTVRYSAFMGCTSLQEVTIPESLTTLEGNAFYGDVKLNSITYNAKNCFVRSVDTYDNRNCGVFSGAGSASAAGLKVVFGEKVEIVPDYLFDTASIGTDRHSGHAYAYITEIEFSASIRQIGEFAFRNCRELETAAFASSDIEMKNGVFDMCSSAAFKVIVPSSGTVKDYVMSLGIVCEDLSAVNE